MLAAAQTPFGSPGRSASAEAAAKAALEAAKAATQTLEESVEANEGGASHAAAGGAAMAVEVVAAPAATPAALADYYYSTADEKETDAIETICNSKSPINKAHAIYYFKNQEYFIDYCNEFVLLSNENDPAYYTEYKRLIDFLQRVKFIEEIKKKNTDLIKKTYNMLLCNIPSAKYDYYLYDCLREVIEGNNSLSENALGLFYKGPTDDIFDDELKKSHVFYYLQYIE
jgi:hypothetical protein